MPTFPPPGPIAGFCDRLVAHDLPDLPAGRRAEVVAFAGRRIAAMPIPMRLGVGVVSCVVEGAGRLVGRTHLTSFLARRPLPVVGEYVRLVRSLVYARVWDAWPDTSPTGGSSVRPPGFVSPISPTPGGNGDTNARVTVDDE